MHKGFIDKFIGDAIMALFPEGGRGAINAAIAVQKLLRIYNSENEGRHGFPVELGIGLHTGRLMLGTVGDRKRLDTTVISDAVNLASRIENLTRVYGADILVSAELLKKEDVGGFSYRFIDRVRVKGKSEPVTLYEILDGLGEKQCGIRVQNKDTFEYATSLYRTREFASAEKLFRQILEVDPGDGAARLYLDRCVACAENPELFCDDGISIMTSK
jgi:two-component system sensor histidine kinase ChiS